jgi:hypothetical protein
LSLSLSKQSVLALYKVVDKKPFFQKESFTKEILYCDEENEGVELYCRTRDFNDCDVGLYRVMRIDEAEKQEAVELLTKYGFGYALRTIVG